MREVDCILTRRNIDHGLAGKLEAEGRIAGDGAGAADIEFDAGAAARLGAIIVQRGRDRRRRPRRNERHAQREVRHSDVRNPFLADVDENGPGAGLNLLQRFRRVAALPGGPGRALQVGEEINLALFELGRGAADDVLDGRERARQVGIAVRQAQGMDFVRHLAGIVRRFRNDAPRRRSHEHHAEAVAGR